MSEELELITIDEVCKLLSYSKSKMYKLTSMNQIEHIKLFNGALRFKKSTVKKLIEQFTIKPKLC